MDSEIVVFKCLECLVFGIEDVEVAEENYRLGFSIIILPTSLIFSQLEMH